MTLTAVDDSAGERETLRFAVTAGTSGLPVTDGAGTSYAEVTFTDTDTLTVPAGTSAVVEVLYRGVVTTAVAEGDLVMVRVTLNDARGDPVTLAAPVTFGVVLPAGGDLTGDRDRCHAHDPESVTIPTGATSAEVPLVGETRQHRRGDRRA